MHSLSRQGSPWVLWCALALILLSSNAALAHGGHHHHSSKFKGSGPVTLSPFSTCGSNRCYTFQGNLTINNLPFTLTGSGVINPNTCKRLRKKVCCLNALTGQFQNPNGNVDFSAAGKGCQFSPTAETLTGPMQVDGSSGTFEGQTGKGVLQAQIDPSTGQGTVEVSGSVH